MSTPHDGFDPEREATVRALAARYAVQRTSLLPMLHDVQEHFGFIARQDVVTLADVLNLSIADVHGVVSFYTYFRTSPPLPHQISVCRGEACQAVGAEDLFAATRTAYRESADTEVSEVFCLGNCALGPSGTADGRLLGRLTVDRLTALIPPGRS